MANPSEVHIYPPSVVTPHSKRLISRCFTRVAAIVLLTVSLTSQSLAAPVDVNTADAQSLSDALSGIGPAIAQAIVEYRKENGPFNSVEDLLNVKGVGPKTLERNKADILIGGKVSKSVPE